jgi:hypothetical protein
MIRYLPIWISWCGGILLSSFSSPVLCLLIGTSALMIFRNVFLYWEDLEFWRPQTGDAETLSVPGSSSAGSHMPARITSASPPHDGRLL